MRTRLHTCTHTKNKLTKWRKRRMQFTSAASLLLTPICCCRASTTAATTTAAALFSFDHCTTAVWLWIIPFYWARVWAFLIKNSLPLASRMNGRHLESMRSALFIYVLHFTRGFTLTYIARTHIYNTVIIVWVYWMQPRALLQLQQMLCSSNVPVINHQSLIYFVCTGLLFSYR